MLAEGCEDIRVSVMVDYLVPIPVLNLYQEADLANAVVQCSTYSASQGARRNAAFYEVSFI